MLARMTASMKDSGLPWMGRFFSRSRVGARTAAGVVLATIAFGALAQTASPRPASSPRRMTLRECIDYSLAHNLQLKKERYTGEIERYTLQASRGIYDPVFSGGLTQSVLNQPPTFDPKKSGTDAEYNLNTKSANSAVSGLLPFGLNYSLGGSFSQVAANSYFPTNSATYFLYPPNGIRATNAFLATAGVTLSQPLLKDAWIDRGRETVQINRRNLEISEIEFKGQVMGTLTAVAVAYHQLGAAGEQVAMERQAVELARRLLADVNKKAGVGDSSAVDQKTAEAGLAAAETALLAAEQQLGARQNALKGLLADSRESWAMGDIEPADKLVATPADVDMADAVSRALQSRPEILAMKLTLEKQDIHLRFTSNQRLPSLNLVGSYGWQAWDPNGGTALDQVRTGAFPVYSVGMVLSFPLGNVSARNNHKAGKAAKAQALVQFDQIQQQVLVEVDTAVKAAELAFKRIESTRRGREASRVALDLQQKLYNSGLTTTYQVLEYQRNLAVARLAEIRALADYNIALAQLDLADARTLERNQIELKVR